MIDEDFAKGKWPFGGEGKPDDVPVPSGIAAQISDVLSHTDEQAGEYSFGGQADTLPAAPGLVVDGVGSIPVPITAEQAQKLIEKCKKSPFGHNFETKTDEAVRQSWQLEPTQVRFENMTWQSGIEKLCEAIADRLGYKDIPLRCVLNKLLLYGGGGHFVKHQDTEKEDGMIAMLVIQLPSSHEGGDLVVYRGGEVRHRHDFGKADGTSAFLPHYAVHYADVEHALEKVTKGYRLALVYSICLPPTMRYLEKAHDKPLSEYLAALIGSMEGDEEPFALLLSHEYMTKSIQNLGTGALKGIDSVRVHTLEEANALVPAAKQLRLFITRLAHKIEYDMNRSMDWEPGERKESIRWYSATGENIGRVKKSTAFNFLNPAQETLSQMWAPHGIEKEEGGYMGNEGPTKNIKYARYAIIAWPCANHAKHAMQVMPFDVAMEVFYAQKPVAAAKVRTFMEDMGARLKVEDKFYSMSGTISIKFCRLFCELALEAGDPEIVRDFFANADYYINKPRPKDKKPLACCSGLDRRKDNGALIPVITKIARKFDWGDFGDALVANLDMSPCVSKEKDTGYSSMEMALLILDDLDGRGAQHVLLKVAMEKSTQLTTDELCSSPVAGLILKWVVGSNDDPFVAKVADKFKQLHPSLLIPTLLKKALECFTAVDSNDEKVSLLTLLVSKRTDWLKCQIDVLDKPFSWQMPFAQFPDNAKVQEFLQGPAATMTITEGVHKFKGFQDASNCVGRWTREGQVGASFKMKASAINANAVVTITKTRKWFGESQQTLKQYKEELAKLLEYSGGEANYGGNKMARLK